MNGHRKGDRYQMLSVREDTLLTLLLRWRGDDVIRFPYFTAFPDGCEVHAVRYCMERRGIVLMVWHASFPEVPPGCEIPYAGELSAWEEIELRRSDLPMTRPATCQEVLAELDRLEGLLMEMGNSASQAKPRNGDGDTLAMGESGLSVREIESFVRELFGWSIEPRNEASGPVVIVEIFVDDKTFGKQIPVEPPYQLAEAEAAISKAKYWVARNILRERRERDARASGSATPQATGESGLADPGSSERSGGEVSS